ncbi:hypothetical protein C7477_1513 [Phyllobacterium leguminum]|uniref:Uncharacterized protein n=1 Tax=Phyllobacterium leguminum TaxID=314237 RepID=A0A318SV61_9HYPH|nr:hypothetical protein C7477_1513 [Phyllobacterium leguminum]
MTSWCSKRQPLRLFVPSVALGFKIGLPLLHQRGRHGGRRFRSLCAAAFGLHQFFQPRDFRFQFGKLGMDRIAGTIPVTVPLPFQDLNRDMDANRPIVSSDPMPPPPLGGLSCRFRLDPKPVGDFAIGER